ncbi:hypothetical protein BS17DRAFT_883543, partial [Gyrodon lividus]
MPSNGTKRKHEGDWDVLDLTGPTPVYSKLASTASTSRPRGKSQSASRTKSQTKSKTTAASATSSSTSKAKPAQGDSCLSTYDSRTPTLSSHQQPSHGSVYREPTTYSYVPTYPYASYSHGGPKMHPHPSEALPPHTKKAKARKGMVKSTDDMTGTEKPEKRGAMTKKKCPKNILGRVERVLSQRQVFFMIDRRQNDGELGEEFSVLGSTGNVGPVAFLIYYSHIDLNRYTRSPSTKHLRVLVCTIDACKSRLSSLLNALSYTGPDATKGNHCKHILFIFLKVLQVPQDSHVWYQKALLTSELAAIFADAPPAPNSLAYQRVRDAYVQSTGQTLNGATMASGSGSGGASGSASGSAKV